MELVVDANENTEGDDLDMLDEELTAHPVPSRSQGRLCEDYSHQEVPFSPMFCYVLLPSSHDRSGCKFATVQKHCGQQQQAELRNSLCLYAGFFWWPCHQRSYNWNTILFKLTQVFNNMRIYVAFFFTSASSCPYSLLLLKWSGFLPTVPMVYIVVAKETDIYFMWMCLLHLPIL
jgi:hypothetical protein